MSQGCLTSAPFSYIMILENKNQMKLHAVLLSALLLTPTASLSQQRVYMESYCYENTEEYVPGYYDYRGTYVNGYVKTNRRRVPCGSTSYQPQYAPAPAPVYVQPSAPRCSPARTTLGGLLGGGAAAALSKQEIGRAHV